MHALKHELSYKIYLLYAEYLKGWNLCLSLTNYFIKVECFRVTHYQHLFQTFGTPNHHPKSQPFYDHVYSFSMSDNRIWFRNYQIMEEDGALAEIGKLQRLR